MRECLTSALGPSHITVIGHHVEAENLAVDEVPFSWVAQTRVDARAAIAAYHAALAADPAARQHTGGRFVFLSTFHRLAPRSCPAPAHLLLLDPTTTVAPDDFVPISLQQSSVATTVARNSPSSRYLMDGRAADRHGWSYFPDLEAGEIVVTKQWDSDPTRSARFVPVARAPDATQPRNTRHHRGALDPATVRIDLLAFFPDDTCTCPPADPDLTSASPTPAAIHIAVESLLATLAAGGDETRARLAKTGRSRSALAAVAHSLLVDDMLVPSQLFRTATEMQKTAAVNRLMALGLPDILVQLDEEAAVESLVGRRLRAAASVTVVTLLGAWLWRRHGDVIASTTRDIWNRFAPNRLHT